MLVCFNRDGSFYEVSRMSEPTRDYPIGEDGKGTGPVISACATVPDELMEKYNQAKDEVFRLDREVCKHAPACLESFQVTCNSCGQVVEAKDWVEYLALKDKCPHCGGQISVQGR